MIERHRAELAKRDAVNAAQAKLIATLTMKVEALEALVGRQGELLGRNSGNSNLPPSSDGPAGAGGAKSHPKPTSGRTRGGQKKHKGSHRALVSAEQVDEVVDMYPGRCEACDGWLPKTPDPRPKRHQHTELAPFAPHVTEYRRHEVCCPTCGHRTRALYDDDIIPSSAFGPRLMATVALLTGVYHLSRRKAVTLLYELLGLRISTGSVSNIEKRMSQAVEPAFDDAWAVARAAPVQHTDGTTWRQAGALLALWTVATVAATVFKIVPNGQRATLEQEIVPRGEGVLVSDRAAALKFWAMERRQICWAHLLRKFVSFSERDGPTRTLGRELLDCTGLVFAYWVDFKEGSLTREQMTARMAPVRADFERTLQRAIGAEIKGLSGSCADIWEHQKALWTFVETAGVEPTNNHAERELRGFVLWRKRSFGSQSDRGNRFAERLMTIAHTARKQGREVRSVPRRLCEPSGRRASAVALRARLTALRRARRQRVVPRAVALADRLDPARALEAQHRALELLRAQPETRRERDHRLTRGRLDRTEEALRERLKLLGRPTWRWRCAPLRRCCRPRALRTRRRAPSRRQPPP